METRYDVVIVGVHQRGYFLAETLAKRGLEVALIDVTSQFKYWDDVDWEGPMGVFESGELDEETWSWLNATGQLSLVPSGFAVWLESGPIEMGTPLGLHVLGKKGVSTECISYLRGLNRRSSQVRKSDLQTLKHNSFEKAWPAHLAHQFVSSCAIQNPNGLEQKGFAPLLSPFHTRRVTEASMKVMGERAASQGVKIYKNANLVDVSISGRALEGVEISSERSGVVNGRQFVWMLSAEETRHCSQRCADAMFSRAVFETQWAWVRSTGRWETSVYTDVLPAHLLLMRDIHLPWSHADFSILQKSKNLGEVYLWMKIPSTQRSEKNYLMKYYGELVSELERRIPALKWEGLVELPKEHQVEPKDLGPTLHPIYTVSDLKRQQSISMGNTHFLGPERWNGIDNVSRLLCEQDCLKDIFKWWSKENEKREKRGELRDSEIHTR